MEVAERQNSATPPHQGHRDELLRKSNPLWEGNLPQVDLVGRQSFDPSVGLENGTHSRTNDSRTNEFLRVTTGNKMPSLEMSSSSRNSVEHY
jgi:hypothetical protein